MPGATPEFKAQLQKAWDSLEAGAVFSYRRTFTEGDVALFCAAVRATTSPALLETDGTLARERFMWRTIPTSSSNTRLRRKR